jgi:hypothetical protein
VLSEWEAGVLIRASKKEIPRATVWDITYIYTHTAGVATGPAKDLNETIENQRMWGWSYRHRLGIHHTHTIWDITQRVKA